MAFLHPLLLLGAAGLLAPVLLHLLGRRPTRRVPWAAMRFLQASVVQQRRRLQLEELLLLAARCLLLLFLALAMARPILRGSFAAGGSAAVPVTAVIALDNSASMGATDDGAASRFDLARRAAEQALDALPSGSRAAVLLVSDIARGVIPEPTGDLRLARQTLREARLTDRATDWRPGLRAALGILARRGNGNGEGAAAPDSSAPQEIDLVTDGQASGWQPLDDIRVLLRDASRRAIAVRLISVGGRPAPNLGLSALRLASALPTAGRPLRFEAEVTNYGSVEARNVPVSLAVDGEPPGDAPVLESIPPGASRGIGLIARLRAEGLHTVTARLPADRFPADDSRTVALRVWKEIRVLLVEDAAASPREGAAFYLRQALAPVPAAERAGYFVKTRTISPAALDAAALADCEAAILAGAPALPPGAADDLAGFVRRGGGLVIFPGPRTNSAAAYNRDLFAKYRLLPAELGEERGAVDGVGFTLAAGGYEHPVVTLWNDPAAGSLAAARFYRAFALRPDAAPPMGEAGAPRVVLPFADGSPALVEHSYGAGSVYLFASTGDAAWNDLPVRPAFVPLLHRVLSAMLGQRDARWNGPVGGEFIAPMPAGALGRNAAVLRPGEATPGLRPVEMLDGAASVQIEDAERAGAYRVSLPDDPGAAACFAAQADPRESRLEELSAAQWALLARDGARVLRPAAGDDLRAGLARERQGSEWRPALAALALVCALAETLLADRTAGVRA